MMQARYRPARVADATQLAGPITRLLGWWFPGPARERETDWLGWDAWVTPGRSRPSR
jgi:hypothetical protein